MQTPKPTKSLLERSLPTALETATFAVTLLENNPLFNSAHGAVFTRDGINELEASVMVSRGFAKDAAGTGVTVNAVSPGIVSETPDAAVQPGSGGQSSPRQIADLVAFLSSPLSAVSGESIAIGHRVRGVTLL